MAREKARDRRLVPQIQLGASRQNQIEVAAFLQLPNDRGTGEAAVARHKNLARRSERRKVVHTCCFHYYWPRNSAPNSCARRAITCSTVVATSSEESVRSGARNAMDTAMLRLLLSMPLPANTSMHSTDSRYAPPAARIACSTAAYGTSLLITNDKSR